MLAEMLSLKPTYSGTFAICFGKLTIIDENAFLFQFSLCLSFIIVSEGEIRKYPLTLNSLILLFQAQGKINKAWNKIVPKTLQKGRFGLLKQQKYSV